MFLLLHTKEYFISFALNRGKGGEVGVFCVDFSAKFPSPFYGRDVNAKDVVRKDISPNFVHPLTFLDCCDGCILFLFLFAYKCMRVFQSLKRFALPGSLSVSHVLYYINRRNCTNLEQKR